MKTEGTDRHDFISSLYKHVDDDATIQIREISGANKVKNTCFLTPNEVAQKRFKDDRNIFYTVATRIGGGKKEHINEISALWNDIDFKDTPENAADRLLSEFPLPPTMVVSSGGGYHPYWRLNEPATQEDIPKIEYLLRRLASKFGGDFNATDASRLLRLPGTYNNKYSPHRYVRLVEKYYNPSNEYDLTEFDQYLPELPVRTAATIYSIPSTKYKIDAEEKILKCEFIRFCKDNSRIIPEPLWYAMISNLCAVRPGGVELCHSYSKGYPKYNAKETDDKILHAIDGSRPHTCDYIQSQGFCCEQECGVKCPADFLSGDKEIFEVIENEEGENQIPNDHSTIFFPSQVFTGVARDYTNMYCQYLESPPQFFYMSFLTCLGNILSGRLGVESELNTQPRLYTLLLGASGETRKSTSASKTVELFRSISTKDTCRTILGVNSAEGLQKAFEDNSNILLFLDEFKQFVSKCKIDNSALLPCVNTLFESNKYESRTKKQTIELENAHMSLLAASTISTYEDTWSKQFTDIGFNNRLFLVPGEGERKFAFPQKISDQCKSEITEGIVKILRHVGSGTHLSITPNANSMFEDWYHRIPGSIHTTRIEGYALRLAMLITANDLKPHIDSETMEKSIALSNWQITVRQLHDPIDADNKIARMEENIRRHLLTKGVMTDAALRKAVNVKYYGSWAWQNAIKNLKDIHKELIVGKQKGKNVYKLNHENLATVGIQFTQ